MIRISDLISERNTFITRGNLNESGFSPLEAFGIMAIKLDAMRCK